MSLLDIKFTEPKLKDFKCFKLPIDNLLKYKEVLIFGNVYNFFGTFIDDDFGFTQTSFSGESSADNFMNFGQFMLNGGRATIIASKETCNYYRRLYKEFYKAGFGTTHPNVTFFEIDDIKFLTGKFKIKEDKEEKIVKGEYFWSQNKKEEWEFNYLDLLKTIFKEGEKRNMPVIMNPPYDGTLFLKIMDYLKDRTTAEIIALAPVRWIQDVSAVYKNNSPFKKYKDLRSKIRDLEIIPQDIASSLFKAGFPGDLGIYEIDQFGGFSFANENTIIKKVMNKNLTSLWDNTDEDKGDGWRVRVSNVKINPGKVYTGNVRDSYIADKIFYVTHVTLCWVYENGLIPETYESEGVTYEKGGSWLKNFLPGSGLKQSFIDKYKDTNNLPFSIHFETKQEAYNFEKSLKTNFYRFLCGKLKGGSMEIPLKFLPFMNDYKTEWTDERFFEYFGISKVEQQEIWDFLNQNKVPDIGERP